MRSQHAHVTALLGLQEIKAGKTDKDLFLPFVGVA